MTRGSTVGSARPVSVCVPPCTDRDGSASIGLHWFTRDLMDFTCLELFRALRSCGRQA